MVNSWFLSCTWIVILWGISNIDCDTHEQEVNYYENLIVSGVKESENYRPLTSSNAYRPRDEYSAIGK